MLGRDILGMVGYLALRSARSVGRCGPLWAYVGAVLAIGLALTFWYVTLPVVAALGLITYVYRRQVLAEHAAKRQARVEQDRLADARARADRKGIAHQSVYSSK